MLLWCEYCGQSFYTDPYYHGQYKFCSEKCKSKFLEQKEFNFNGPRI